ncbi:ABC transporter related [Rubrobacter xylanophilus DSM 9941]|uniref:ABC transporter related n=1 Tax=Rubrobacter xylanophilus (strain DSM 9941 / JCM 11954 / NBRC 16129 / PRD-1) TaxID=266117 RepID=Q1AYY8_RUBXD|nr:ABC transporter ATP-binding protein [Rubrobacter xylanophilus]ABG03390.1 ABC transporter related [Rubrobacter xylanophilus DSM 9941]
MKELGRLLKRVEAPAGPAKLRAEGLVLGYDEATVIDGLEVEVPPGRITSVVGPNGCGKSTLLRSLARLLRPRGGGVYLDGKEIFSLPTREVARRLGILPQSPEAPEGLTVRELAAQGRYPHQSWLSQWSASDERAVERALQKTGMLPLADRPLDTLSGGQRQRAWISMALAQETETLLLDEPTTFLDLAHQLEVLQLLGRLNAEEGRTVVMVLHDLNNAARYSHHVIALHDGGVYAAGPPEEVVTPELLRDVFHVEADVVADPRTGLPLCVPYGLRRRAEGEEA